MNTKNATATLLKNNRYRLVIGAGMEVFSRTNVTRERVIELCNQHGVTGIRWE